MLAPTAGEFGGGHVIGEFRRWRIEKRLTQEFRRGFELASGVQRQSSFVFVARVSIPDAGEWRIGFELWHLLHECLDSCAMFERAKAYACEVHVADQFAWKVLRRGFVEVRGN